MKKVFYIIVIALQCFIFVSCGSKTAIIPPKTTQVKLNLIIDNSKSMEGYLCGNTEFQDNTSNLVAFLNDLNGKTKANCRFLSTNFYTVSDSSGFQRHNLDAFEFIAKIKSKLTTGNTSPIDVILKNIIDSAKANEINVFVSDFIISDNTQNSTNLLGNLKGRISTVFSKAKGHKLAILIYKFDSEFSGKYYTCKNTIINLNGTKRPYYIWFLGNSSILSIIKNQIELGNIFQSSNQLQIGFKYSTHNLAFLNYTKKEGTWFADENGNLTDFQIEDGKCPQMVIGLNLSELPKYALGKTYLTTNLKVESQDINISDNPDVYEYNSFKSQLDPRDNKIASNFTHFIVLKANKIISKDGKYKIYLINDESYSNWYLGSSTDDDTKILTSASDKTFGLKQFISGIQSIYNEPKELFNIEIKYSK